MMARVDVALHKVELAAKGTICLILAAVVAYPPLGQVTL